MTKESDPNLDSFDKSSSPIEKISAFTSLRIRNFRWLLAGTTLGNAGQWLQQVTISWLAYDITGSGTILGTINLVRSVASLGLVPIAGVLIDRLNRRTLMLMTNGWLFTITLVLGIVLLFSQAQVSYLFVFSFLGGMAMALNMPIRQVVVFDLVPRAYTPNALALIQTGWSIMRSFGPAIGGFLIIWFGPGGNFLTQSGAYALIAITIIQIQFPLRRTGGATSSPL